MGLLPGIVRGRIPRESHLGCSTDIREVGLGEVARPPESRISSWHLDSRQEEILEVECASCGRPNREGRKFCGDCGVPLTLRCGACDSQNELGERFCGECGAPLASQPAAVLPPTIVPTIARAVSEAERRQLTVMFCDLVGSTALSEELDPEELRELVRAYQQACAEVIERHEGHIAQYLGDGLLVYFGYPLAHEDDARRAIRAALGILEAMGSLNRRIQRGTALAVRLGIHTGLVVVGEVGGGGRQEQLALGETPNMAARLQGLAEPNTVVVSMDTLHLAQGYFNTLSLGLHKVKGISRSIEVFRIDRETDVQDRLDVHGSNGLTPLIGRADEVEELLHRWDHASFGTGQIVLIQGEAGIGKSRLLRTIKDRLATERHVRIELRCSAYHRMSALYPVIDSLRRVLRFDEHDSVAEKLAKLASLLEADDAAWPELVPLLAALLSLPHPSRYPDLSYTPELQRRKTLDGIVAWLLRQAERVPILIIVEDLHWIDPSTRELLSLLVERLPSARMLALVSSRPGFDPPWQPSANTVNLTLDRLTRDHAREIVEVVAGGKSLPAELLAQILARTDGVPLFVEELTKMVLESPLVRAEDGRYELESGFSTLRIPSTLQDSLMARLDRLATSKETAQLGAALGREFSFAVLQALSQRDATTLQRDLERLIGAEILHQQGALPQATFGFNHALMQEAAYNSLLKSRRVAFHRQIADVLVQQFPDIVLTQPEVVARHYTEGQLPSQAIRYWIQAAERAVEGSANWEAIDPLAAGLALLNGIPSLPERNALELSLQVARAAPLMAARGTGAPEVERA
ncbi:MAG: adenylate/guanylate cyclase domain-containing protein [Dehalococcoidia bacterium]